VPTAINVVSDIAASDGHLKFHFIEALLEKPARVGVSRMIR
jgi:hypothetical protein